MVLCKCHPGTSTSYLDVNKTGLGSNSAFMVLTNKPNRDNLIDLRTIVNTINDILVFYLLKNTIKINSFLTGSDPVWTTNDFALVDSYLDFFLPKNRYFPTKQSTLRLFADNSLFLFNQKRRPAARREIEPTSTRIRSDWIKDERLQ